MDDRSDSSSPYAVNRPSHDEIARHAYALWERGGRRSDSTSADEYWLIAERELTRAPVPAPNPSEQAPPPRDQSGGSQRRIEPTRERPAIRHVRQASKPPIPHEEHPPLFIVVDSAHFRAYQEAHPIGRAAGLVLVEAFDLTTGRAGPYDRDSDQAGRFGRAMGSGGVTGGSFDERLPMKEERERRIAWEAATAIERCFAKHGGADWYLAAGPRLQHGILAALRPEYHRRLRATIVKDLVKHSPDSVLRHFAPAMSHAVAAGHDGERS